MRRFYVLMGSLILFMQSILIAQSFAAVNLDSSTRVMEVRGAEASDYFGRPLVCADFNGDGADDFVVGADRWSFNPGQRPTLYIFRGRGTFVGTDVVELTTDTADAVIYGETGSDNLATALAAGDVNGDGIMDLIAADSTLEVASRPYAGAVYVLFGRADFFNQTVYDFAAGDWDVKILGAKAGDDTGGANAFGGMISHGLACGDLNRDGIDDIAIGAHLGAIGSWSAAGKVYLVFGRKSLTHGSVIDLVNQANVTIQGNEQYAELGTMIAIGDINGDGASDLVLGEEYGSVGTLTTEGKIFCFWGKSSWASSFSVSTANLIISGAVSWDCLGTAVALSDVNGDGILDLICTADGWSSNKGAIYGFYGRTNFPAAIALSSQQPSFIIRGFDIRNEIGKTLVSGDFNGDGIGDILFSSRDGERDGFNSEGRTYLVFGKPNFPSQLSIETEQVDYIINGGVNNFQLGDAIAAGDLDNDGADEFLIAAPFVDGGKGRLLVFDLNPQLAVSARWEMYE
ncbi:MAG TPA: FG-GAP and VCBS repeat-containing protein [Candidatus Sumerlaeia bacterium]|nr:FG-GAP and VCBS repeat-containing protein [Candidatus Sumerlaeia bacterium]